MKAVVLVGGEGTRMRPLTETLPKPLIPLVDRPFLDHVLDHLAGHGVEEAFLSSPYLEATFAGFVEARRGRAPSTTWITEPSPLGTGGAISNAARGLTEPFLALNGDVLTDLDLGAMVAFHRDRGAVATISLAPVEDARPYGLVDLDGDGRVRAFREKPAEAVPGSINAGTYVLDPATLRDVPAGRPVSIEREVFPVLVESGEAVFGFASDSYWLDMGTPERYLQATFDVLEGRVEGLRYVAPHVDPSADLSLQAHLGRLVVIGPRVRVEDEAEVEDSVLLAGSVIERGARVRGSIVGPRARVGRGAEVSGAVLAEGASIPAGARTAGARVGAGAVLESAAPLDATHARSIDSPR